MFDYFTRLIIIDKAMTILMALTYGAIPGFLILIITDSVALAIGAVVAGGLAIAMFMDRVIDRERDRSAARAKRNRSR